MPDDPKQELIVALAGPAVNVVIAAGLYVGLLLGHGLAPVADTLSVGGNFLNQMLVVNVSLAVFNLLPAFPMDGFCLLRDMDQHAPCMGKARQPGSAFRAEDDHVVPMTWLRLPVHVLGQIPDGCRRLHGEIRAAADRA